MGAICKHCNRDMMETDTCIKVPVVIDFNEVLDPIRYKSEAGERCHDCNVAEGGFHHPGCDWERCPKCGGQLISCGCLDKTEGDGDN